MSIHEKPCYYWTNLHILSPFMIIIYLVFQLIFSFAQKKDVGSFSNCIAYVGDIRQTLHYCEILKMRNPHILLLHNS